MSESAPLRRWHLLAALAVVAGLFIVNLTMSQRNRNRRKRVERQMRELQQRLDKLEADNTALREKLAESPR